MSNASPPVGGLETQDRDQLLKTVRLLLAEANALSSRIAAVNEIGIAINHTLDINEILRVVARQAKWLLDFEHCSVSLKRGGTWQVETLFGAAVVFDGDLTETDNVGRAIRYRQPQILRQGSTSGFLNSYNSQLIIPLQADDEVLGTINFATLEAEVYTTDDMRIGYMLALQLSAALRNAHLFEELKNARDTLHAYTEELEAKNQELDAYSHTIAHDLKSPLSSISLRSDILLHRYADQSPEMLDMFKGMQTSARQMNDMIDQLLMLARLRRIDDVKSDVAATPVAYNAVMRFMHLFESKKIISDIMPDMPHAVGHPQLIEEVFANLISNGIKYMGDGDTRLIKVRGEVRGEMVRYEVSDTGIGISAEDQKRLFQMFTRLHTISAEGLGLGLSIVHRITTRLGGTVGVYSTPGAGSTFWFELPRAMQEVDEATPELSTTDAPEGRPYNLDVTSDSSEPSTEITAPKITVENNVLK